MKVMSQLWLLKELMNRIGDDLRNYDEMYEDVDPDWVPKPCEYFVRNFYELAKATKPLTYGV